MSGAVAPAGGIAEFLEARIAEDERDAKVAKAEFAHGAYGCYGPARVIAECHAKRRMIQYYRMLIEQSEQAEVFGYHATGLKTALRFAAAVYKDHPDYKEEWQA